MSALANPLILVFFASLLLVAVIAWVVAGADNTRRRALSRRLNKVTGVNAPTSERALSIRREQLGKKSLLERIARDYLPRKSALEARLARTGKTITVGAYLAYMGLTGVGLYITFHFFLGTPPPIAIPFSIAGAIALPHILLSMMIAKRSARFIAGLPDAIDLMVRGLRSGLPISEGVASVGREADGPVGEEFTRVTDAVRFGRKLDDALWDAARRIGIAEFKFFVISLSVQQETGGNLGETLANLATILRQRKQMKLKIKAMSSEARASALILGALPFLMFLIIFLMNPGYATQLLTDMRGQIMLAGGGLILGGGFLVMAKMVRFEI